MRRSLFALLGVVLVFAAAAGRGAGDPTIDQRLGASAYPVEAGGLVSHLTATTDGQPLILTVVDPRQRWIGVYHVERTSGEVTLKSARNITYDEQLIEYNSGKPLPTEIRSGLPR